MRLEIMPVLLRICQRAECHQLRVNYFLPFLLSLFLSFFSFCYFFFFPAFFSIPFLCAKQGGYSLTSVLPAI